MKLRKLTFEVLILISFPLLAGSHVQLKENWMDSHNQGFDLNTLLKTKSDIHILYFRATDCLACIENGIEEVKKYEPKAAAIVGYIYESELKMVPGKKNDIKLLLDKNYELYLRLRIRKLTPVILKVNKERIVTKIIDVIKVK